MHSGTSDFIRGCPRACACELCGRMGHWVCEVVPTSVRLTVVFLSIYVVFYTWYVALWQEPAPANGALCMEAFRPLVSFAPPLLQLAAICKCCAAVLATRTPSFAFFNMSKVSSKGQHAVKWTGYPTAWTVPPNRRNTPCSTPIPRATLQGLRRTIFVSLSQPKHQVTHTATVFIRILPILVTVSLLAVLSAKYHTCRTTK